MKKASSTHSSISLKTGPKQFEDELAESKRLRLRLRAIMDELHETITMLEENLRRARSSAQPQRGAGDGSTQKRRSLNRAQKPKREEAKSSR